MIEAAAFCGEEIACYTTRAKDQKQIEDCTTYLNKIIRANGYKCHVKIFDREKAFLERLDSLNRNYDELEKSASENFKPDERQPGRQPTTATTVKMLLLFPSASTSPTIKTMAGRTNSPSVTSSLFFFSRRI